MHFGISLLSLTPARKEPSETAEMVTQLLFGECYRVLEQTENWLKVQTAYDDYECWINSRQHTVISEKAFLQITKSTPLLSSELVQVVNDQSNQTGFPITIGATLPLLKDQVCSFDSFTYSFEGAVASMAQKRTAKEIISTAFLFLNTPYLWGGKSPFGIDCSGFTQLVFKLNGYKLPRDAWQQVNLGDPLNFVEEAEAGDLAFFDNEEGHIIHAGILLDNERIIHASGSVRIDRFDHYGIFHTETKKYSHTLRVIKRLI